MQIISRFVGYFGYVIFMVFLLMFLLKYDQQLHEYSKLNFKPFPLFIYRSIYPILLGVLFALPSFIKVIKTSGRWRYDWIKITSIGLPALLGSQLLYIYFSPAVGKYLPSISVHALETPLPSISGVVFGYLALNCFHKSKNN